MKVWVISPVHTIQIFDENGDFVENQELASVLDLVVGPGKTVKMGCAAYSQEIGVNSFGLRRAILHMDTINMNEIRQDNRFQIMPDHGLDTKVSAMHGPTKTKMKNDLDIHGFKNTVIILTDGTADGFRDIIRGCGRELNPNFDENMQLVKT